MHGIFYEHRHILEGWICPSVMQTNVNNNNADTKQTRSPSLAEGLLQHHAHRKTPKTCLTLTFDLWPGNSIGFLRLSRYMSHVHAKLHQAKSSSSWVINSALDLRQLKTFIVNISGMDPAIDNWKMALWSKIFSTFWKSNFVNFGPLMKKWPWPLTYYRKIQ